MHKLVNLERDKIHGRFFAAILILTLPLDHAVDKMSVSHAMEICKHILTWHTGGQIWQYV